MSSIILRFVARHRPQPEQGSDLSTAVLVGWYARKGALPALRGLLRAPLLGSAGLPLFLGRAVRIDYGNRLFAGRGVQIGAGSIVNAYSTDGVRLSDGVTVRENAWIQCSSHPSTPGAGISVGPRTYIGPGSVLGAGGRIEIGADCQFGARVTLIAENHRVVDGVPSATDVVRLGIRIGDGCWLGHGATVLDGVELGAHCVVGAGAVVTKSYPERTTLVGVPARPINSRAQE